MHSLALELARECIASEHSTDAKILESRALDGLGRVARESGDYDASIALHTRAADAALAACSSSGAVSIRPLPQACLSNAISNAGVAAMRKGDSALAASCHRDALRRRKLLGDFRGTSSSLGNLAALTSDNGEAIKLYEESLKLRIELGDTWGIAGSHRALAHRHVAAGDGPNARTSLASAVPIFEQVGDALGIAECLETLGLLEADPRPAEAAELLGAAVGVRIGAGAGTDVVFKHEIVARLRDEHPAAWSKGERLRGFVEAARLAQAAATV
eukprot:TRINITY_DN18927_c0_g1_i2.p1 TRINITY_DN18927_c0_g1~~TRINITY_DN18927_c0_g1_i2.p1  ORF type:complete len:273 (-),score=50.89 TRINITY_DN18927_c0_g1_i2:97-915(-)